MTAARVYARYSTDNQSETSIADQLRICRGYADAHGLRIVSEHTDEGISGAAIGNRPGVRAVLDALDLGDVLLVVDLSRLSRSQDLAPLLARLAHRGVRVIGVQDGFDSDSRHARMQAGLSGIMSEEFRAMIADRTRSALESRARAGKATGGKAYDDPVIVREIFARFANGETMKAIASDLNRRGVPSPGAGWKKRASPRGKWVVSALHSLLKNERYIGQVIWNRSRWVKDPDTGTRKRRERPRSEWIITECEPYVDQATWGRVQARIAARAGIGGRGSRGGKRMYLLSGLLECGECEAKLIVIGGSQHRYACSRHHGGGAEACPNGLTVPRLTVEERILSHVKTTLLSPKAVDAGVKLLREARASTERELARERPDAYREVDELKRMVREGLLSREVAAPAIEEATRRAKAEETALDLPWPTEKLWREAMANIGEVLETGDVDECRDALAAMIGTVRCIPRGDHILAKMGGQRMLLATGTGRSVDGMVAGACYSLYLPISTRRSDVRTQQ